MKIQPSDALKSVKLFAGSLLDSASRVNALTDTMLVAKRDKLLRCDDRTSAENELLRVLDAEIKALDAMWEF